MRRHDEPSAKAARARPNATSVHALRRLLAVFVAVLANLCVKPVWAHSASDAYLTLASDSHATSGVTLVHAQWDVALRDLDFALALDADGDGNITWNEVRAQQAAIARYVYAGLKVRGEAADCRIVPTAQTIDQHADGAYAVMLFDIACRGNAKALMFDYGLFFAIDPSHRGIVVMQSRDGVATALVSPDHATVRWTP
jgi:hypothetical protein